jgi:hypothetical protein
MAGWLGAPSPVAVVAGAYCSRAIAGIERVVEDVVADMAANGEKLLR